MFNLTWRTYLPTGIEQRCSYRSDDKQKIKKHTALLLKFNNVYDISVRTENAKQNV